MKTEEEKLTGYPSIDKPWLKYYSDEAIKTQMPEGSMYEYMAQGNREHLEHTALVYLERKISYSEMFHQIDRATRAFSTMNLKKGDIVTGIAIATPEMIYAFYALNRLGIITSWIDPRSRKNDIEEKIKKTKSKVCLVFEEFWDNVSEIFADSQDIMVIILSLKDSAPSVLKPILALKNRKRYSRINLISYAELLLKGEGGSDISKSSCEQDEVAVLEYTGGTTGDSKGVMLTNLNCNAVVEQYRHGGTELAREHSWLSVAFPFVAYSLVCSIHLPLAIGMTCYLCFSLDVKNVQKILIKHRVNHMANTPMMWEQMLHSERIKNMELSFLMNPTVGADSLDIEKERQITDYLHIHGCSTHLAKGYGMTEAASAVSVTINKEINKFGSVGIPFCKTTIAIFDWDTGKELPYNQEGEICICGPSVMKGYYENITQTAEILRQHSDGNYWLHSGDIGYMDEDGFLFIKGRMKRMLIDFMGFKIFAPQIESTLMQIERVEAVCVVGIKDTFHNIGQVPIAFVVADRDKQGEIKDQIEEKIKTSLPDYYHLEQIYFVEELPYTNAGKVDYRKLEEAKEKMVLEKERSTNV